MQRPRLFDLPAQIIGNKWLFHLLLTAGFIALALWRVDVSDVAKPLGEANYGWAALALLVSTLVKVIDTVRWQVYLAKVGRVPFLSLLGAYVIGNLGNNLLPMRAGDIAKIQILANRYRISRASLAAAVFVVEAVLDGVTFLVFLLVGLALLDVRFVPAPLLWSLAVSAGGGFLLVLLVCHLFPPDLAERRWLKPLPQRLRQIIGRLWPRVLDGLEGIRNWLLLAKAIVLNFAGWFVQVVVFWMFGLAFGLDLSFSAYIVIMIAANLVVAVPITFQNIGTYEVVLLEILVAFGVAREEAFAYAVATHIITNLWIIATGLVAVWLMRISPREVIRLRAAAPEAEVPVGKQVPPLAP